MRQTTRHRYHGPDTSSTCLKPPKKILTAQWATRGGCNSTAAAPLLFATAPFACPFACPLACPFACPLAWPFAWPLAWPLEVVAQHLDSSLLPVLVVRGRSSAGLAVKKPTGLSANPTVSTGITGKSSGRTRCVAPGQELGFRVLGK